MNPKQVQKDQLRIAQLFKGGVPILSRWRAFSLIEMLGVLAVIAIIAAAIASVTPRSIDQAFSQQEGASLQGLANALQNSIVRNLYIPGSNDWWQRIAMEAGLSTNAIVLNARNTPRMFLIDPNLQLGPPGGAAPYLPYTQGTAGSVQPVSARLMLLSSLSVPLPPAAANTANFSAIWNTVDGYLPTNGCFSGWNGQSSDLKIQRINLSPLFENLALANYLSTNQGQYRIDGQGPVVVPTNGVSSYFIQNTIVTLLSGVSSGSVTNVELMIGRDLSLFYVNQVWRDVPFVPDYSATQTNGGAASLASEIALASTLFVRSPYNTAATAGVTPPQVLNLMSNFMASYVPYANWVMNSNGGNWAKITQQSDPNYPIYTNASYYQSQLATALSYLANPVNGANNNINQNGCTNGPQ